MVSPVSESAPGSVPSEASAELPQHLRSATKTTLPEGANVLDPPIDPALEPDLEAASATRRGFLASGLATAVGLLGGRSLAAGGTGTPVFRIHPAIGIARVGNADADTYFIGPEIPGKRPLGEAPGTAVPPYKVNGKVKPQATRFRIFEYQTINGRWTPVREITLATPGIVGIQWKAHLANKKASFYKFSGPSGEGKTPAGLRNASVADRRSLEIDFGPRTIGGASQGPIEFKPGTSGNPAAESCPKKPDNTPVIDYLGQLRTDSAGRLIVLGGLGRAAYNTTAQPPTPSYANNDNWFDDVSDGPVTAVVTIQDATGATVNVPVDAGDGAWVLVGPPDFAPDVPSAVTLYDVLYDMAVRELPTPLDNALYDPGGPLANLRQLAADFQPLGTLEFPTYVPNFADEIKPLFDRGYAYRFVTALVNNKHDGLISPTLGDPSSQYAKTRTSYFAAMRTPKGAVGPSASGGTMPKALGDDPYTATSPDDEQRLTQTRTQYGLLRNWSLGKFSTTPAAPLPNAVTPHGLDRAQLESMSGGAFYPGMEVSWQIRNAALYEEPFRLDLNAMSQYYGENTKIGPGHFSRQMAVPWHADFTECANEGAYGWWPATRPDDCFPSAAAPKRIPWARSDSAFAGGNKSVSHEDMIDLWYKFGFVVKQSNIHIETERAPKIP